MDFYCSVIDPSTSVEIIWMWDKQYLSLSCRWWSVYWLSFLHLLWVLCLCFLYVLHSQCLFFNLCIIYSSIPTWACWVYQRSYSSCLYTPVCASSTSWWQSTDSPARWCKCNNEFVLLTIALWCPDVCRPVDGVYTISIVNLASHCSVNAGLAAHLQPQWWRH